MYESVTCQKCHDSRDTNLKSPCKNCGARKTLFGYVYEHEYQALFRATIVIATVLILAVISAIIFLFYQQIRISNSSVLEFAKLIASSLS